MKTFNRLHKRFKDLDKLPLQWLSAVQALGVSIYCLMVAFLMTHAQSFIQNEVKGGAMFLLLFILSAIITSLLVFGKPYKLFFAGKKNEAIELVAFTAAWLGLFFIGFLISSLV